MEGLPVSTRPMAAFGSMGTMERRATSTVGNSSHNSPQYTAMVRTGSYGSWCHGHGAYSVSVVISNKGEHPVQDRAQSTTGLSMENFGSRPRCSRWPAHMSTLGRQRASQNIAILDEISAILASSHSSGARAVGNPPHGDFRRRLVASPARRVRQRR